MEWPHPHIQVPPLVAQPLEASTCIQRMATTHVPNTAVEPFEKVGDDKGLEANLWIFNVVINVVNSDSGHSAVACMSYSLGAISVVTDIVGVMPYIRKGIEK